GQHHRGARRAGGAPPRELTTRRPHGVIRGMDLFGKAPLVEIPILITEDQKTWLETLVRKGKIAVPPGGTLPEGSVISIFIRTAFLQVEQVDPRHDIGT